MQRGLIEHRAGEKRIAALFQGNGQALKPVCPLTTHMAQSVNRYDLKACRYGTLGYG